MITELPAGLHDDAVALWHRVGLTRPWNDPVADLRRALAGPSSTVLASVDDDSSRVAVRLPGAVERATLRPSTGLASVDDGLLGTAMVGVDGHRGWMYYLAVEPSAQGRGIGRALVSAAEEWVVARGVPKLMLMVRHDNAAALGFYAALGYEVNEVATLGKRLD